MKSYMLLLLCILVCASCVDTHRNHDDITYDLQAPGRSANDILSSNKYTELEIQIKYMPGSRLSDSSIHNIQEFLSGICHKPDGITITQEQIDVSKDTITLSGVEELEKTYRTSYTGGRVISIYVLITNGYSDANHIAAYTYRNTSIVIYGKIIADDVSFLGKVHMETFLLQHELGHAMGLVNLGTKMQSPHEDSVYPNHCINPSCTMNYGSVSTQLDSNCMNDLRANGGK